ncbi:hypothetical protein SDC9_09366 [bioreactor metagenome]|uniref:pPIWI-RE three-gene island domain-containing protein n=1 Tax=bioreactor metagenome TaxID=1076179 RepID=A0A644T9X8_9ZZZZ
MRQGYRDLTKGIKKELNDVLQNEENRPNFRYTTDLIIRVELMLTGFNLATAHNKAEEAWSLIPGYDFWKIAEQANFGIIGRMRILFGFYRAESLWNKDLAEYGKLDSAYRLYRLMDNGLFKEEPPRYVSDRKSEYHNILMNPIPHKRHSLPFVTAGVFNYQIFMDEKRNVQGNIPVIQTEQVAFPRQRSKKPLTCDFNADWLGLPEEMEQIQKGWLKRANSFELASLKQSMCLNYRGINHLAGGLGTGKSTFRVMETYRLVKKHQAKVGLLEGTVAEVVKRVKELNSLGINAVPIIGPSGRKKHLNTYLFSHAKEVDDLSGWVNEEHRALSHLSGICFIQALSENFEDDKSFPCQKIVQDNKPAQCSFAASCGIYADFRKAIEADVWVTTSAAVLKTRLPGMLDPAERTVFEVMYDLLDVIFVDEADYVQEQFDRAFLEEYELFGAPNHLLEQLENELTAKINGRYSDVAGNPIILNFRRQLKEMIDIVWQIFELLNNSPRLRKHLAYRKVFHIYALAHDLTDKLAKGSESSDKIWAELRGYISNPFAEGKFTAVVNQLLTPNRTKLKEELIEPFIASFFEGVKSKLDMVLLSLQLELFLYLGRFEDHLKNILQYADIVFEELNISSSLGKVFNMRKEFSPFMKEGMTGMMVGYRYFAKESSLGTFKFFEYSGVGRLLLKEWSDLYDQTDGIQGPGVVFLSGTSVAPGSRHYELNSPVDWLMKTRTAMGKIEQFYHPLADPETGELIFVSGTNPEKRGEHLEKEVRSLKPLIKREIEHWNKERKILLVVNSYDDLERVASVLSLDPEWKDNFKILSRGDQAEEGAEGLSFYFPLSNIEQFVHESAEILVAPLLAMNRGHNILDARQGALFGTVFFLIRPYPVPDNLGYMIQALHAQLPNILETIEQKTLMGGKAIKELRKSSILLLEMMVRKPDFWSILSPKERKALAWFILVPVWQMIGRLLRGGRDARVFYIDAKFGMEGTAGTGTIPSLLSYWRTMLEAHQGDKVIQSLYGSFLDSLPRITKSM